MTDLASRLGGDEGVRFVLRRSKQTGALAAGFGIDQTVRLWRVERANLSTVQVYQPGTYSGSATLFLAEGTSRPDTGPYTSAGAASSPARSSASPLTPAIRPCCAVRVSIGSRWSCGGG